MFRCSLFSPPVCLLYRVLLHPLITRILLHPAFRVLLALEYSFSASRNVKQHEPIHGGPRRSLSCRRSQVHDSSMYDSHRIPVNLNTRILQAI